MITRQTHGGLDPPVDFDDGGIVAVAPSIGPRPLDESAISETCDLQQRCGYEILDASLPEAALLCANESTGQALLDTQAKLIVDDFMDVWLPIGVWWT